MKIYIDYDNTLINLIDPWVVWINNKYNVNITSNDINRWYFLREVFGKEADDFWRSEKNNHYADKNIFKPNHGANFFLQTMQKKMGEENVFIISSTKNHHILKKIEHAQYFFGIAKKQFIPVDEDNKKYKVTKGGILIDDYPLNVMEHVCYNQKKGIVFNHNDRFGWGQKSNFVLDTTLAGFLHIVDDKNFSVVTSYEQINTELNHA